MERSGVKEHSFPFSPSSPPTVREYQSIPRLDTYDEEHLDEEDYDAMDPEARAAAEKAMRKRDRQVSIHQS